MQTALFDYTSTSTCTGSPIIVSFIQDSCSGRQFEINSTITCSPVSQGYNWQETSCNPNATTLDMSKWKRNYVVKEIFTTSSTCDGQVSQAFAVAADDFCHPMTMVMAATQHTQAYVMVNCNGGSPVWNTCWDNACQNCTTDLFGGSPCKLMGAAASNKIRCIQPQQDPTNTNGLTPTSSSTVTLDNAVHKKHVYPTYFYFVLVIVWSVLGIFM